MVYHSKNGHTNSSKISYFDQRYFKAFEVYQQWNSDTYINKKLGKIIN